MPQLAVPVSLVKHILSNASKAKHHKAKAHTIANLICIAFYYLLRVGEYTKQSGSKRKLTKPFRLRDITFRDSRGNLIPQTAPLATLLTAAEATLRISNQKNSIKGQCIHQQCTGTDDSPVKALARHVYHILSNGGNANTYLYNYYKVPNHSKYVDQQQINTAIKDAADKIGLHKLGYDRSDVSSHSLRAGGAMAMHLNGVPTNTIQKIGRWRSQTFLMYIHKQISALAAGVSLKMSNDIPFRHIAGPHLLDPT